MTTRRDLLRGVLGLGGLAAFSGFAPRLTSAHAGEVRDDLYYVFCYFSGGWDLLLGLDPRDPRVFRDDLKKSTRIQPGYGELAKSDADLVRTSVPGMVFGPHIGGLARHADKLAVVRGMSMDTLTHEVGRRRFLTGRPPAGLQAQGSSLATLLAATLGRDEPIPQLSVRVESYNDTQPSYASAIRVTSVSDLLRALRPAPGALSATERQALEAVVEATRACGEVRRSSVLTQAFDTRLAAQDLVSLGLDGRFDLGAKTDEMEAVRSLYGIDARDLAAPGAQAAAAVTALTSGIARCVSVEVAKDLDAHGPDWSGSHGQRCEAGFDVVASMIDDLASRPYKDTGDSWLDHTTIVGFSEFGRTPLLNSSGGRDHHLHNAAFLVGGGIRGGRVHGASSDLGMAPVRMDLASGHTDPGGEIIKPEHLCRAILQHAGITDDIGDLRVDPLTALYA
ncbi:MAG: DUF1501 domain-containing protein [Alphaproteobacteria bacterium]|nr:DUF1501 domain-containing protein [Alphaproteobacteria bacterium]